MNENINTLIRINKVYIKNYKGIDELEITFTKPLNNDDPDVFVLSSANGFGKTSILECCSLFFLFLTYGNHFLRHFIDEKYFNMIIGAGKEECILMVTLEAEAKEVELGIKLVKNKGIEEWYGDIDEFGPDTRKILLNYRRNNAKPFNLESLCPSLFGIDSKPLLIPLLQYFHRALETKEGNTQLKEHTDKILHIIRKNTLKKSGIVLFDEPERHLLQEGHKEFISILQNIAPGNQYILGTHSEDIVSSVDSGHSMNLDKS